jgi:hypothetical protein
MAMASLSGCKIKKIDLVKDKVTIVFEGKSDEIVSNGKNLAEALKELSSTAYLALPVSIDVSTSPQTIVQKPAAPQVPTVK